MKLCDRWLCGANMRREVLQRGFRVCGPDCDTQDCGVAMAGFIHLFCETIEIFCNYIEAKVKRVQSTEVRRGSLRIRYRA
jgi:hypothetical protein